MTSHNSFIKYFILQRTLFSHIKTDLFLIPKHARQCRLNRTVYQCSHNHRPERNQNAPPSNSNKKTLTLAAGLVGFLLGYQYLTRNKQTSKISFLTGFRKLDAASNVDDGDDDNDDDDDDDDDYRPISHKFNFIADVVEMSQPAIVYIESKKLEYGLMAVGHGSGFIVQEDGIILTNAHVVHNCKHVSVKLHDGSVYEGKVQTLDETIDLATIKIEVDGYFKKKKLPVLRLGDSNSLRIGEWVVAMGSPLKLNRPVTAGIVTKVHRQRKGLGFRLRFMEYIQHDAVINKGSSGGPLLNLDGEVVGINTLKMGSEMSFAICSDTAKEFLKTSTKQQKSDDTTVSSSKPVRYFGVKMLTLTPSMIADLKEQVYNFPQDLKSGVLVLHPVRPPANRSGLQPLDIIVGVNGRDVKTVEDIQKATANIDKFNVGVLRGTKSFNFVIVKDGI